MSDLGPWLPVISEEIRAWAPIVAPIIKFGVPVARAYASRFIEKYHNDSPATQSRAIENNADVIQRLRREIDDRISRGELTEEQVRQAFERPDFSKHAEEALLKATEISGELQHDELAKLLAARLVAPEDSSTSILLRMACDQLSYLNSRQLRMLGLSFALLNLGAGDKYNEQLAETSTLDELFDDYASEIAKVVAPFRDLEPPGLIDFQHFDEIGLAKLIDIGILRFSGEEMRSPLLEPLSRAFYAKVLGGTIPTGGNFAAIHWIRQIMEPSPDPRVYPLKAVRLTPLGLITGNCMYCIAHGYPFEPRSIIW